MKIRYLCLLIALVMCMPLLSACDLFGGKSKAEKQQEYYQQQIDAYNEAREAYRESQEQYYKDLEKALQEWAEAAY